MLVDKIDITVTAGKGGSGLASFRKEKYLPFGGPDGGDGGKGGDVYLQVDGNLVDLSIFKNKRQFSAKPGGPGGKNKKHGINAPDMIIRVPVGTKAVVYRGSQIEKELDLIENGRKILIAMGGKGGKGNVHFASPTHKAPREYQEGQIGETKRLSLEMYLPVDVCIIGGPNSGKSSLLNAISNASPRVADYAFTTRDPILGLVDDGNIRATWAEIPALIPGSHNGRGLGNGFLKHLHRAKVIIYLLDATSGQLLADLCYLRKEVESYNSGFGLKKYAIAINKADLVKDIDICRNELSQQLDEREIKIFMISSERALGLGEMVIYVNRMIAEEKAAQPVGHFDFAVFHPEPLDGKDEL
jgi:GTP-binding protein